MRHDHRRITLIVRDEASPSIDWDYAHTRESRVAFLDAVGAAAFALDAAVTDVGLDIERVIVDRAGTADDFLNLLTQMPSEIAADVLLIRDDGGGFLSAAGRGGDRVMYALGRHDVRFYLETHGLVTGREALELTA